MPRESRDGPADHGDNDPMLLEIRPRRSRSDRSAPLDEKFLHRPRRVGADLDLQSEGEGEGVACEESRGMPRALKEHPSRGVEQRSHARSSLHTTSRQMASKRMK